jgi:hypothetical protein
MRRHATVLGRIQINTDLEAALSVAFSYFPHMLTLPSRLSQTTNQSLKSQRIFAEVEYCDNW